MRTALFLDLGGTLVRVEDDEIYTTADGRVEFLPNTVAVLRQKAPAFETVFIVTNQSSIEKGTVAVDASTSFIDQVNEIIGGRITDFWACPLRESSYRKPNPGMITGLADKHFVDLKRSVMVGDAEGDRHCAQSAGVGQFIWSDEFFSR